jgi:D-glycero-alpha-D-manno-heptose 1-phosphate guanylyltransferase
MECIVLAGGLGTRLQGVIGNFPKCMAPLNNKPFLYYVFEYLKDQKITKVILSLGYKHEVITDWLATQAFSFAIDHVIETEPLGTGGGIGLAMTKAADENIAVLNGDTIFKIDLNELLDFHLQKNAATTLALKQMHHFDRYGVVHADSEDRIMLFEEKRYYDEGWINGGIYIINKQQFLSKKLPEKYSFEKDYLEKFVSEDKFFGYKSQDYFIDIGIPADYEKAKEDFKTLFT